MYLFIVPVQKRGIQIIFFLFLHEKICCVYSLEAPPRGASNKYQQQKFSWRNKKKIYQNFSVETSNLFKVILSNLITFIDHKSSEYLNPLFSWEK